MPGATLGSMSCHSARDGSCLLAQMSLVLWVNIGTRKFLQVIAAWFTILGRSLGPGTYKTAYLVPASVFVPCPMTMTMMLIFVLSVFIVQVWSKRVIANTTSGLLLGTQTDGGTCFPWLLSFYSRKVMHWTSGIFQRRREILTIMYLE